MFTALLNAAATAIDFADLEKAFLAVLTAAGRVELDGAIATFADVRALLELADAHPVITRSEVLRAFSRSCKRAANRSEDPTRTLALYTVRRAAMKARNLPEFA